MSNFISFKTLKRPPKPNTYLVAPDGLCLAAEPDEVSQVLKTSPPETFEALQALIAAERSWIDLELDPDNLALKFVARSALMRFKDDVDIAVLPTPSDGGSQIAIYSRSRVGYSDLGANKKRVDGLLQQLIAK